MKIAKLTLVLAFLATQINANQPNNNIKAKQTLYDDFNSQKVELVHIPKIIYNENLNINNFSKKNR